MLPARWRFRYFPRLREFATADAMSRTTLISTALAAAALGGATGSALAQGGGTTPTGSTGTTPTTAKPANPCLDKTRRPRLRCPDLIMYRPYDLYYDHAGGRTRLHAGNSIVNVGQGPSENFGIRIGQGRMKAVQHIYAVDGSRHSFDNGARLVFKSVPGQHHRRRRDRLTEGVDGGARAGDGRRVGSGLGGNGDRDDAPVLPRPPRPS